MSRLEAVLARSARELDEAGVGWALVGGLAVSVRCEARFTRDLDLAVSVPSDREAEALVARLLARGYRVLATVEQEAKGRLATVRLEAPGETERGVVLDLLFASSGVEPEVVDAAEPLAVFPGLVVRVALRGDLLALKVLARDDHRRPQDRADLAALLAGASEEDLARARSTLSLIRGRGFHRNRDLLADFEGMRTGGAAETDSRG